MMVYAALGVILAATMAAAYLVANAVQRYVEGEGPPSRPELPWQLLAALPAVFCVGADVFYDIAHTAGVVGEYREWRQEILRALGEWMSSLWRWPR